MKRLFITSIVFSVLLSGCNNGETKKEEAAATVDTEAPATETAAAMPDSATMMNNWMAYMTPGDIHSMIAKWDGTWTAEISMWMAPGAPPEKSKGIAENKMILGGRYQQSTHKSMMMGQPFEGQSTLAYDNAKQKFTSTWIDNMGTGVMVMEGVWDEANKAINFNGMMVDPMAGAGKEIAVREIFKIIDDNTQLLEMYAKGTDGKEFKTMEIVFTRK